MSDTSKGSGRRKSWSAAAAPKAKTKAAAKSRPKKVAAPETDTLEATPVAEDTLAVSSSIDEVASAAEPVSDSLTAAAEPPVDDMPAAMPPRATHSSTATVLWSVVSVAILVGIVYATAPFWSPPLDAYLPAGLRDPFRDPRMVGLGDRVHDLEARDESVSATGDAIRDLVAERSRFSEQLKVTMERVDALDSALSSVRRMVEATAAPNEAALAEKALRALSERLASLEQTGGEVDVEKLAAENARLSAAVAAIAKRVGTVEDVDRRATSTASSGRALVVAVGQLREALRRSGPFVESLDAVKSLAGDDAGLAKAIADLQPAAASGVASLTALRADFEDTASRVVWAEASDGEDGLVQRTINRLSSLVRLRPTGDATGDGTAALVARAEASLAGGDLDAAVATLDGLNDAAAAAAKAWLDRARGRLAAQRALVTLHVLAMSRVGPAGS